MAERQIWTPRNRRRMTMLYRLLCLLCFLLIIAGVVYMLTLAAKTEIISRQTAHSMAKTEPICTTNYKTFTTREQWIREQVKDMGTIIYSDEEIAAEAAAKLKRRKR